MKRSILLAAILLLAGAAQSAPIDDAKAAAQAKDYDKSFKLFKALADADEAEAQYQLGEQYEQGQGVEADAVQARHWYDKAAAQGHPDAMIWIGHTYEAGVGVTQDYQEAMSWFRKALAKKAKQSYNAIGVMYDQGEGVEKNAKEADKWYRKGAEAGDPYAMHNLSVAYHEGSGVGKDLKQMVKWERKAADLGFAPSMFGVGGFYFQGVGLEKDYARAYDWYKKAADLGQAEAQLAIGHMYLEGKGMPLDRGEALRWFRKAADQNDANGLYNVGWCYDQGFGAPKDPKTALSWYQKGADAGSIEAAYALGYDYFNGEGVAKDVELGCNWFRSAAQHDNEAAKTALQGCPGEGEQAAAAAPPTVAQVEPAPATPESAIDAPAFKLKPRPSDVAVVIGIENYRRAPRADYAESDAAAVAANLVALGFARRNVVTIAGEDATRSRIQAYLDEWLPKNVKADSTVFFYYSGHGAPDAESGDAYLLPADGDPSFLKTTAYALRDVYGSLNRLPARQVIVALDSCFSGAGGRSVIAKGARPLVTKTAKSDTGKLVVFAAAQGEQITGGYDADGHGLFTYFFLKGLQGEAKDKKGLVTAKGLYGYLKPLVEDEARRQNREQSPTLAAPTDAVLARF